MKLSTVLLVILLVLSALKYFKIFNVDKFILIGLFLAWLIIIYINIHYKNQERRNPKPVYITDNPEQSITQ